ncbi:CNNM domain-containing protein [Roseicitreum antarcticum]|uniref:Hemolysin, contains CBS domains n=1 Tax=Roseicitreum antarcticum TaxID=564137 RepID=A0A1H3ELH9_9RHOB|nr:hemolysin family protein [Roseicitreum antarcticum]SDX78814.1 Hemolysin, contains CBS domains [Roseicitreum antarcticum]
MFSLLIAFLALSIAVSFICSLWEAVLLSISPSYMQIELKKGSKSGVILRDFKDNIDRPLAGILTLNTIAHTVGAIGVGAQATLIWGDSYPIVTGLVVPVAMTAAILILSEIIPKTIGATNWRALAPFTIRSLHLVLKVLAPIIWLCQQVTGIFNADKEKQIFSRTDFLAMAQIGSQEGHLDPAEVKFIENLLRFRTVKAEDVMTPRTVVVSALQAMTAREFYDHQQELTHSRIPLREDADSETIVGYVLKDDVLEHLIDDAQDKPLSTFVRDIIVVPEGYNIFQLFNDFMVKHEHIALVVDSYGGTAGIVTMEDVIETLLGAEIVDETDTTVDMQDMARQQRKNRLTKS